MGRHGCGCAPELLAAAFDCFREPEPGEEFIDLRESHGRPAGRRAERAETTRREADPLLSVVPPVRDAAGTTKAAPTCGQHAEAMNTNHS